MAPKSKKQSAADKAKDLQDTEDPLQAVILADSFERRFMPFDVARPRCLLPLANTPLIEYTLEFLANSGVDEVYVYSGAHTELVEEYLLKSKWMQASSPFRLEVIKSVSRSIGDAMRDLDKRAIMGQDFILVYGDVVSNATLDAALAEHRARKAKDKNAVMTMVLREAGTSHRTKSRGLSPVFVIDPNKKRCLHYEQISHRQPSHHIGIDPDILLHTEEIDVRHDLIDCGIDICTPDVLALWSDNFDYEAPRKGFLNSVLKDYELNGKTIHTHIMKDHYAARVRDLHSYNSISRDIISRWAYPLSPETNIMEDQTYVLQKGNVFLEDGVQLSRSCKIRNNSMVGRGARVGAKSEVSTSVVGRSCSIGDNCVIEGSYIWEGATIKSGSVIRHSIVGMNAVVGENCNLKPGTLVSMDVELKKGVTTKESQRLVRSDRPKENVNGSSATNGAGADEESQDTEIEDEDFRAVALEAAYKADLHSLSDESISTLHSDLSDDEPIQTKHTHSGSFASINSDDTQGASQAGRDFITEAAASIFDSLQKGHDVETIQFELQGLRMSTNASEHQRRQAVVSGLVQHILQVRATGAQTTIKQVLEDNATLVERQIFDKDKTVKPDQVDFLLLAQAELARAPDGPTVMLSLCNGLYALDLIEGEALEQWWQDKKSVASEQMKAVRSHPKMEELMRIIGEDSEEDEEDEEDDDDDDDDDE